MPRLNRYKTGYPGVYYVMGKPLKGAEKPERIYYVRYRRYKKEIEEKAGREIRDRMTPEKAAAIRSELINGIRLSRKELREQKQSVMLYLSKEAYATLIKEEAKSGRNFSEIIDRALLSLYTDDDAPPSKNGKKEIEWDKIRSQLEDLKEKQTDEREISDQRAFRAIYKQAKSGDGFPTDENKYREILEHSFDLIYRLNLITGKFEYASPASSTDWLISPEELLSKIDQETLIVNHVHPGDQKNVRKYMNEAVSKGREGEGRIMEFRAKVGKGKKYSWFANIHTIVYNDDNTPIAMVGNVREITERKKVEQKTLEFVDHLEQKVKDYATSLEESNAALKILLKQNRKEKFELEEKVHNNIDKLVMPVVEKLKRCQSKDIHKHIGVFEANLNQITSSFSNRVTSKHMKLTHKEVQVANYVMNGKTTKEIAGIMGRAERTIDFHRARIRKKLGLLNKKKSLRTHLLTLQ